ncbi:MAG: hypothetical protein FWE88_07495 [Phycisphaerae bacterium]|nr:hypothetical protein [Phycisphaerae bacterium]
MLTRMVFTVAAAVVLSLPTLAQGAGAKEIVGTLTGDNVAVRSGPSTTGAYRCTKLSTGDKVVVLGTKGEWYQIKPVQGAWSVIAKKFVKPDAGGKTGVVTGDNVWVRAAGEMCTFANVADFYVWQGQLNKDDKVSILGEAGDYYKIVSPPFATFYIAAKYVDLSGKDAPGDKAGEADAGEKSVGVSAKLPASAKDAPAATTTQKPATQPTRDSKDTRAKVEAVRLEMMAEYEKPVEQRDLRRIIEKFNAIDTAGSAQGAKLVAYYTKYMENQLAIVDEAKAASVLIEEQKANVTTIQIEIDRRVIETQAGTGPKAFNAQGILRPSAVFPGTKHTPQRWVVYDPTIERITAYVQCTTGEVNVAAHVGKHVGVFGAEVYDKDLRLYIVEAQEIQVMKDGAEAAEPRPQPQPAKAEPEPATVEVEVKVVPATEEATDDDTATDDEEDDEEIIGAAVESAVHATITPAE